MARVIAKAHALDRVFARSATYHNAQLTVAEERHNLAQAMVEAKELAGATQQEIANATAEHEDERLSRQRVKQLIDDYRSGDV